MTENKAEVTFNITKTKNLGNYESIKIQVGLSMSCDANKEEIDKTYKRINKFVNTRLEEEENQWQE